jgi:hypothetical protein
MLVELHSHTNLSKRIKVPVEGINTPEEMVRHAKKIGLDALAITDHDEIKGSLQAMRLAKKYDIIVIPGIEVTTRSGHLLGVGVEEFIQPGMSVEDTIDEIHRQGGLAIGGHPFDINNDGIKEKARLCDAVEVFNAINIERIMNNKSKRFAQLHKKPQVAGSDAHCIEMLGYGVNEIDATNVDGILRAIKKGRVTLRTKYIPAYVMMKWSITRLKLSYPFVLNYINKNYSWPKRAVSRHALGLVKKSPGRIDYFFKGMAYFSLGSTIFYTAIKEVLSK